MTTNWVAASRYRALAYERLRKTGKSMAKRAGYALHEFGSTGRPSEIVIESICNTGWLPRSVIDVGVAFGTREIYEAFPAARYLLIEPLKEWVPEIERATRHLDATIVCSAAASFDGEMDFFLYRDLAASSSYDDLGRQDENRIERVVPTITLDTAVRDWTPELPMFCKIDVQGGELDVLEGSKETLSLADLLFIETSVCRNYVDGPSAYDVISFMGEHGYRPFDFFGGTVSGPNLAQIDIAFVRAGSELWNRLGNG